MQALAGLTFLAVFGLTARSGGKEQRVEGLADRTLRDGPLPRPVVRASNNLVTNGDVTNHMLTELVYPALAKDWHRRRTELATSKSAVDLLLLNFNVRCRSGRWITQVPLPHMAAEAIPGISCRRSAAVRKHDLLWSADMWILLSEAPQPLGGLE